MISPKKEAGQDYVSKYENGIHLNVTYLNIHYYFSGNEDDNINYIEGDMRNFEF